MQREYQLVKTINTGNHYNYNINQPPTQSPNDPFTGRTDNSTLMRVRTHTHTNTHARTVFTV